MDKELNSDILEECIALNDKIMACNWAMNWYVWQGFVPRPPTEVLKVFPLSGESYEDLHSSFEELRNRIKKAGGAELLKKYNAEAIRRSIYLQSIGITPKDY